MKNTIFVPKTIRVGYQNRTDTYTGKLAYVIYYDSKGKLRKETSWESWRNKEIEPANFSNVPTSGFVLNKKVGDYKSDWNHRKAHIRIYDPRGFEFEISPENLLYILENTSSIKGKGIEGECVYGWDSKDLVLIPVLSPDYAGISEFSNMISKPESIKTKDLILGATYRTNKDESWVYLGKFDNYETSTWRNKKYGENLGKKFYFRNGKSFETISSISGRIVKLENSECHEKYADWMDELETCQFFSPIDESKTLWIDVDIETADSKMCEPSNYYHRLKLWTKFQGDYYSVYLLKKDDGYYLAIDGNGYPDTFRYIISSVCYGGKNRYRGYGSYYYSADVTPKSLEYLFQEFNFKNRQQYLSNGKALPVD